MSKIGQINIRTKNSFDLLKNIEGIDTVFNLGPDEWLAILPYEKAELITQEIKNLGGIAINLSDNRVYRDISGPNAHLILQKACHINIEALKKGDVIQTLYARTQVIIQCLEPQSYRLFFRSSFAKYTEDFIMRASKEYLT